MEPGLRRATEVSIRASRAGGDARGGGASLEPRCFNPRLPRGRRRAPSALVVKHLEFQSAPPAREATRFAPPTSRGSTVSIRASRAGGDSGLTGKRLQRIVSIRASRAGGDPPEPANSTAASLFQSAPPAREATGVYLPVRAEDGFQSAPPAREATRSHPRISDGGGFQSAPPAREATPGCICP